MKGQPTPTQVRVLLSDWLGNLRMKEEGHFVHRGKGGIAFRGGSVARYIAGNANGMDTLTAVRHGREAASQVVSAVTPEPSDVQVGGNLSYHVNNGGRHHICLATDYFDEPSLDNNDRIAVMLGLAAHEAAHAAFTDSDAKERMLLEEPELTRALRKDVWNIIEDERIEYLLGDRMPGYADLLGAAKAYYFKKTDEDLRSSGQLPDEPLPKLLAALTLAVRYPSQLTEEEARENFSELDAIRKVLTPYPLTPEGAAEASGRIIGILKDLIKKQLQEQKRQQQEEKMRQQLQQQQQSGQDSQGVQGGAGSPQGEGAPGGGHTPGRLPDGKDGGQKKTEGKGEPGDGPSLFDQPQQPQPDAGSESGASGKDGKDSKEGNDAKDQNGGNGAPGQSKPKRQAAPKVSDREVQEALRKALATEQAKRVLDAIRRDESKADGARQSATLGSRNACLYANDPDVEAAPGSGAGGGIPSRFIFKPRGDAEEYSRALRAVRPYIPAMSKALSCKSQESEYDLRGLPHGKLNTNKLVSFACGNGNIFNKQGKVTCSGASVCILIDESYSMAGLKQWQARLAAVLTNEAVKRISKVNFFCYGYSSTAFNVYAEAGRSNRYALSATGATGGTPTGFAMQCASERIRKRTKDPVLMLVLTDGQAGDRSLVKQMDASLPKKGIQVIGVGILTDHVNTSFRRHIAFKDLRDFAPTMGKLTKGILDRMLVRTDSI